MNYNLKDLRRAADLTQVEVAEQLGINQSTFSRWERDRVEVPEEHHAKLAEILGVDPEKFRTPDHDVFHILDELQDDFRTAESLIEDMAKRLVRARVLQKKVMRQAKDAA